MSIIKETLQNQIKNNDRVKFNDTNARIMEYDRTTETCKIKYLNPNGSGYIYKSNVRIANMAGGVASGSIHPGQECSISFLNQNVYAPVIRGINNSYYIDRSCTDQGAYLADDEVWKAGTPEHIIAMNLDWINEDNDNLAIYESNGQRYTDTDIDSRSLDLVTTLDKYDDNEIGLTNLVTNSTVKLRDNGDIDIFTRNNTGIRICKNGNIKFYGTDIEFTNSKTETTDKSISTQLKNAQIMKICLAYDIIKSADEYVDLITEAINDSTQVNGDFS